MKKATSKTAVIGKIPFKVIRLIMTTFKALIIFCGRRIGKNIDQPKKVMKAPSKRYFTIVVNILFPFFT